VIVMAVIVVAWRWTVAVIGLGLGHNRGDANHKGGERKFQNQAHKTS
jgi:hypothetical protein